jgi:geranylgeranyl diphosphate synthase type I
MRAAVDRIAEPMHRIVGYHLGWWDELERPIEGGSGKAIRPTLTLLCAEAMGASWKAAMDAAVAVELVHNFSLIHDDIIDGDATRRSRSTVWSVFGVGTAILAGDALLALATQVLADSPAAVAQRAAGRLSTAVQEMICGQAVDIAFERCAAVSLHECVVMATRKTASIMSCAGELGALFAGAGESRTAHIRRFGQHLGLAFQIVDDLLGIWGDSSVTGKAVGADLYTRKKSIPVVAALAAGGTAGREFARLYHRAEPLDEAAVRTAADLVEQAGGRRWAQAEADRQLCSALSCLDLADPAPEAATRLRALAQLIVRRDQ